MNLRERNNIDYFIDHLTRFHEPMENIVLSVKGKTEKTLSDKDILYVKKTLSEAKRLWHVVSNKKLDGALYEFSDQKTKELNGLVEDEKKALQYLEKAIKGGDKKTIIKAGLAVKPNFAKLFKSFGHFKNN